MLTNPSPDIKTAAIALASIIGIALFVNFSVSGNKAILFVLGVGLGIALLHAMYGFSGSWKQFIMRRNSLGVRSNLLLLMLASIAFFPLVSGVFASLSPAAALAPVGVSVFVGAWLFGIGMQLGGGCGSGTLFTFGQGQVDMLITLLFFIVGATVGSAHLHWWLALPSAGSLSLIGGGQWLTALAVQLAVLAALYALVTYADIKTNRQITPLFSANDRRPLLQRLLFGPWPLWWGVMAIVLLSGLTLLVAGHTWSVTFAFGLWGAKLWSALGGDAATWPYWASGYPAQALRQSVLADTTSVMNFGIVLGSVLAALLAGKFAPPAPLKKYRAVAAVAGGLLLGYGARLAFGCNVGAMFSGIATGSLHGWLWLAAAFIGNIMGVQLRQVLDRRDATVNTATVTTEPASN